MYLLAHFTRADVPRFADFKDEATRSVLQLDNIRNLFMNVVNDIRLDLGDRSEGNSIPISVKIRDTMTLAQTHKIARFRTGAKIPFWGGL